MKADLGHIADGCAGLRVLVIGEAMLDRYLEGCAGRLCREAPALIITLGDLRDMPGGAANTAVNVRSLGGEALFLSVVGDDPEGQLLRAAMVARGVEAANLLVAPGRRTVSKSRVIADSQMLLRFDQGNTEPIDRETERALIERLYALHGSCQAVIVSDYGYGILTTDVIRALEELQAASPRVLVVDSKRLGDYRRLYPTAVKPNYEEALQVVGLPKAEGRARIDQMARHGEQLLVSTGAKAVALTLDADGGLVFERGSAPYRTFAAPTRSSCTAGAGDTYAAALTLGLAQGLEVCAAAEIASAAAAVVVGKSGTSICSREELKEYISFGEKRVEGLAQLAARAEFYRQQGRRVVFTNGCFDILHGGHVTYLKRAKSLGDVLVLGVNSDSSVRRIKGPGRPINSLEDRIQVLAALTSVDHIVSFDEETPESLIRVVRPSVFVKGGDYTRDQLPEARLVEELGGTVQILPYLPDHSTSVIIQRIRDANGELLTTQDGATPAAEEPPVAQAATRAAAPSWEDAANVLCVRLDSLGDVLMTTPAIRALRESRPGRRITLLTSPSGAAAARLIPEVDEVLVYEAPWMKASPPHSAASAGVEMAEKLRDARYDAAVVFTVYSQSALPAAHLACLSGIPLRLAHSRENPYHLLTHWVRETEPDSGVRHEVRRQLDLVETVGARTRDDRLSLQVPPGTRRRMARILEELGVDLRRPWLVIHPGASAPSRRYPPEGFAEAARRLVIESGCQTVFTGGADEVELVEGIRSSMDAGSTSLAGRLDLAELAGVLSMAWVLVSNNTGPVHVAAAVGTPVVGLYALTNPQHAPWGVKSRVLSHDVQCKYCYKSTCPEGHQDCLRRVAPETVVTAVREILEEEAEGDQVRCAPVAVDGSGGR